MIETLGKKKPKIQQWNLRYTFKYENQNEIQNSLGVSEKNKRKVWTSTPGWPHVCHHWLTECPSSKREFVIHYRHGMISQSINKCLGFANRGAILVVLANWFAEIMSTSLCKYIIQGKSRVYYPCIHFACIFCHGDRFFYSHSTKFVRIQPNRQRQTARSVGFYLIALWNLKKSAWIRLFHEKKNECIFV